MLILLAAPEVLIATCTATRIKLEFYDLGFWGEHSFFRRTPATNPPGTVGS